MLRIGARVRVEDQRREREISGHVGRIREFEKGWIIAEFVCGQREEVDLAIPYHCIALPEGLEAAYRMSFTRLPEHLRTIYGECPHLMVDTRRMPTRPGPGEVLERLRKR